MLILLLIVLGTGILVFIFLPTFSSESIGDNFEEEMNTIDNLQLKKETIYTTIRDLDFEFSMGRLPESDYQPFRDDYKQQAAQVLEQIDLLEKGKLNYDEWIENSVALYKKNSGQVNQSIAAKNETIREIKDDDKTVEKICPTCHKANAIQNRYCISCGFDLNNS